jgi:hypothetical protein
MTRYFVDGTGKYVGGFDGAEPPAGSVEVPFAPDDARQVWDGTAWSAAPVDPRPLTVEALAAALEKKGHLTKGDIDAERGKK